MLALFLSIIGEVSPITVSADWSISSGASPVSSATRTLTVPSGNPGTVRFDILANDGTLEYSYNSGAWTAVTDEGTLSVTNSSTLQFRLTGASTDGADLDVYDNTTNTLIGSWVATIL